MTSTPLEPTVGGFGISLLQNEWSRVCFEAPEDGGSVVADPEPDDEPTPPPEAAETVETGESEEAPEPTPWEARGLRGEEAIYQSFTHAEQRLQEALAERDQLRQWYQQQQAQPEPEPEPDDPWAAIPLDMEEAQYNRVVAAAQRDLPGTAQHVWANREHFGQEMANTLMRAWQEHDWSGAQDFMWSEREERVRAELREEFQQSIAPFANTTVMGWVEQAYTLAGQKVDDIGDYKDRIADVLEANPGLFAGTMGKPSAMAEKVINVRDWLVAADMRQAREQAAAQPVVAANGQKPQTLARSAAAAPEPTRAEIVKASLRDPKVRPAAGLS